MDPFFISAAAILLLIACILLGAHIASSMVVISISAMWIITGGIDIPLSILGITVHRGIMQYIFGTAPLFIAMGLLANLSGISDDLYDSANLLLKRLPGGLAIATVVSNAFFASITGISVASAAVFSKVAIPQMSRLGYNKRLSLGTVAGSSVLGMLIPPSILLIIYGILAEVSIGRLFIAGILPGLLITLLYSAGITLMVLWRPNIAPRILLKERKTRI
ncbi:MAG: TRAP transporter large permease subunit, partial [Bacteroidota bacterium]